MPIKFFQERMLFQNRAKSVAVIVAHPDDETLWSGGFILGQPSWDWFILSLCRGDDPDRSPKFFKVLQILRARGAISDLDDGPEQFPLAANQIQDRICQLLPAKHFDLVITHSPAGEYTRHRRHEETGEAMIALWHAGKINADELWMFAYEDGGKHYLPRPIRSAHIYRSLPGELWQKKYDLITRTYGFQKGGFEAETTPRAEAFWRFTDSIEAQHWSTNEVFRHEDLTVI
jgi:LmbE family N-acetylglucosaminyl deacetylase